MATANEIAKALAILSAAFPNFNVTKQTATAYEKALSMLTSRQLEVAVVHAICNYKFFPTAAEIISAAAEIESVADQEQTAVEAWGEVMSAVARYGAYRVPQFNDPLIYQALKAIGGWSYLCLSDDTLMSDRARFIEVYDQLAKRKQVHEQMHPAVKEYVSERVRALTQSKRLLLFPGKNHDAES